MIIQHNMPAMTANRTYNTVTNTKAKSMEKLSSGYRINRAADDAAGLTISEKLRYQIRGLNKASQNIQDGISLIQVAEGALGESHSILQRMNELATQAANDTNTAIDRQAIQAEIDQLTKELDRVSETTNFNQDIYPLKGGVQFPDALKPNTITVVNNSGFDLEVNGTTYPAGSSFVLDDVLSINSRTMKSSQIFYSADGGGTGSTSADVFTIPPCSQQPTLYYYTMDDLRVNDLGYIYYDYQTPAISNFTSREFACQAQFLPVLVDHQPVMEPTEEQLIALGARKVESNTTELNIQAGALPEQAIKIPLVDASARNMGVKPLDVSSFSTAGLAMSKIQKAIEKVSDWRSTFGACQNRLEHAYYNVQNTAENSQAAESRIRDVDMAEEMQKLSVSNILAQAGESMISQANSSVSAVMALLQ